MPIRNEAAFIERSLGAVLAQDYPSDRVEVLIADGMSEDQTRAIIASMPGTDRVQVIDNPERIQSFGLNRIIPLARGEIIIRVDGHTILELDYVRQCVDLLLNTDAANVGGAMNPVGTTRIGKAIAAAGKSAFAVPTAFHVSQKQQYTDTVYLGAWHKRIFDQVGLYNTELEVNEDYELNYRIRRAGNKILFSPRIHSVYYGRQTLPALARQYFRYGLWKVHTLRQHPRSLKLRHVIAPLFVAGLVIGPLLVFLNPVFLSWWLFGIGVYLLLNASFSMLVALRDGLGLLPFLPFVFLTLHLAWGSGFWVELLTVRKA
jgi:cellulose synthase/poly-beta-1,6-N-acetylglucosamine synthase-like glycosyltransferase